MYAAASTGLSGIAPIERYGIERGRKDKISDVDAHDAFLVSVRIAIN
jgi:hypothetical protein